MNSRPLPKVPDRCRAEMEDVVHQASLKLVQQLQDSWPKLAGPDVPVHAYVLLDSWQDNILADAIQAAYPELVDERCAVPDPHFKNRQDNAPCLLPLPAVLSPGSSPDSLAATAAREHLAHWLTLARNHAQQRLASQHLGAIVFSEVDAEDIVAHWVDLGHQQAPDGSDARLFRYQDPRVMQRVWPALSAGQRTQWLGPVRQWWTLTQPWGPWNSAQFGATELATTDVPSEWFCAEAPTSEAQRSNGSNAPLRALFDATQWHAAHIAPAANRAWAGFASDQLPMANQPDAKTVCRLLLDGERLGLQDTNLDDYVWCSWRPYPSEGRSHEFAWQSSDGAALLAQVLKTLRQDPDNSFANLFAQAMRRKS